MLPGSCPWLRRSVAGRSDRPHPWAAAEVGMKTAGERAGILAVHGHADVHACVERLQQPPVSWRRSRIRSFEFRYCTGNQTGGFSRSAACPIVNAVDFDSAGHLEIGIAVSADEIAGVAHQGVYIDRSRTGDGCGDEPHSEEAIAASRSHRRMRGGVILKVARAVKEGQRETRRDAKQAEEPDSPAVPS